MKSIVVVLLLLTQQDIETEIIKTVEATKKIHDREFRSQLVRLTRGNYTRFLEGKIEPKEILESQKRYTWLATEWVKKEALLKMVQTQDVSVPASVMSSIKQEAKKEWPGDYDMQKYEIDKQRDGYVDVANYSAPSLPKKILSKTIDNAKNEWRGDYDMQVYEIDKQVAGFRAVKSYRASSIPTNVLNRIKSDAVREWPGDYDMQKYEIDKQVKGYRALR